MMVIDTSAIIAIFLDESERRLYERAIADEADCVMSAVNAHEAVTVLPVRQGAAAVDRLWRFLHGNSVTIVAFDEAQVRAATAAFDRYGKGIDSKAKLNICDCAAYALAKTFGAPLLFKGEDFAATDIASAV